MKLIWLIKDSYYLQKKLINVLNFAALAFFPTVSMKQHQTETEHKTFHSSFASAAECVQIPIYSCSSFSTVSEIPLDRYVNIVIWQIIRNLTCLGPDYVFGIIYQSARYKDTYFHDT